MEQRDIGHYHQAVQAGAYRSCRAQYAGSCPICRGHVCKGQPIKVFTDRSLGVVHDNCMRPQQ